MRALVKSLTLFSTYIISYFVLFIGTEILAALIEIAGISIININAQKILNIRLVLYLVLSLAITYYVNSRFIKISKRGFVLVSFLIIAIALVLILMWFSSFVI